MASPEAVVQLIVQEHQNKVASLQLGPIFQLLSKQRVESSFRNTKRRSTPGPDGITIDLLRQLFDWSTAQCFTLFLKSALTRVAPVQHRGGELFDLYKGKGSQAQLDHYRSSLLADCVGKVAARSYRTASIGAIGPMLTDDQSWQCGGVPGFGAEFPALAVRQNMLKLPGNVWAYCT